MRHYKKIAITPGVMCGKPVIRGTRVTVELILRKLSEGLILKKLAWHIKSPSVNPSFFFVSLRVSSWQELK